MRKRLCHARGLLYMGISFSLLSATSGTAQTVKLEFMGVPDTFIQSGTLNHDGSVGANVAMSFSVEFDIPSVNELTILESGTFRRTFLPATFTFEFGNYSLTESKSFTVIQFLTVDQIRFDFDVNISDANFQGTLFEESTALTDLSSQLRFGNDLEMDIWFHNQGATLENIWGKLLVGDMNQIGPDVNWDLAGGDPFVNRIDANARLGSSLSGPGAALLDPRVTFTVVPEPSSVALLLTALAGIVRHGSNFTAQTLRCLCRPDSQ